MKKYLVFLMAALMLVALAVAGCGGSKDEAKAQPEKVLRVATEPTFAPFEFQKEGSDELAGFDMDLIRAIGKKLGYKVEIANMGFEIESFGGNEYAIRAVPVELYGASGKDMIMEIIDDLMENPGKVSNETIKGRIATMACKAAVKGNNRLQPAEGRELVSELMTLDNPYNCPHGRPTMISISKYELEKKFKRIV